MGRLTWLLLTLLIGLATHISYVLFFPANAFEDSLVRTISDVQPNTLRLLSPEAQRNLFPSYRGEGVLAICPVDLRAGQVKLIAHLPVGYWTLSVHTRTGAQVYSINDAEADSELVEIKLRQTKGIISQIVEGTDGEEVVDFANAGWNVELPQAQGIAAIWVPLSEPLVRPDVEATLSRSTCKPEKI
jgi:uncharacterized membrane protein